MTQNAQTHSPSTMPVSASLPDDPRQALIRMLETSEGLLETTRKEAEALALNDFLGFAVMQKDKETQVEDYVSKSQIFRTRINDFRGQDPALLKRLDAAQSDLKKLSEQNNKAVTNIRKHSMQKTQTTLITAQELAQKHPVYFEKCEAGAQEKI